MALEYLRKVHRKWCYIKNSAGGYFWQLVIKINPELHANYEMKRQNQKLIRKVNLKDPVYFNEKMLWLKYYSYNHDPLVAQCYNKYTVRSYIESKGLSNILNDLYGVWDNIEDIDWNTLPDEFVMKVSNGYSGHVFKRNNKEFNIEKAKEQLRNTLKKSSYYFKRSGDLFAYGTKQKIICERLLHSNQGYVAPEDYKFYCFNGEPKYIEIMKDRNGGKNYKYQELFMNIDLSDASEFEGEASPGTMEAPKCYREMVEIAKILSQDFPFVRVDLYVENDKPIFGELTFTPYHAQTERSLIYFGELLKF